MSHEQTAKQLIDALSSGKRPREQRRTCWQNYVEDLAWSHLGTLGTVKLPLVAEDQDAWRPQLKLLPLQTPKRQVGKRKYTKLIQCFS